MSSTTRRVVVTGMGVLTAAGDRLDELWRRVVAGDSAAGPVTRFDVAGMPTRIAAEIHDFDGVRVAGSRAARRLDLATLYALAAARAAFDDAGLATGGACPERVAVVLGTALGSIGSTVTAQDGLVARGQRGVGLTAMLNSHNGAAAAEVAMMLDARALAVTIGSSSASGNDAVGHAFDLLRLDEADPAAQRTRRTNPSKMASARSEIRATSRWNVTRPARICRRIMRASTSASPAWIAATCRRSMNSGSSRTRAITARSRRAYRRLYSRSPSGVSAHLRHWRCRFGSTTSSPSDTTSPRSSTWRYRWR